MPLVFFFFFLCLSTMADAADCATELKSSGSYRELSAALKCLNDRIQVLEQRREQTAEIKRTVPQHSDSKGLIRLDSGCFVIPTNLEVITQRLQLGDQFCSVDGRVASKITHITDDTCT